MDPLKAYEINAPDVIAETFDGEPVILNLVSGRYFSLSGIASSIWPLVLAGHSPETILASIRAQRPELVESSSDFIARLLELNILRERAETDDVRSAPVEGIWSGDSPEIQVFDDCAELVAADPIHDVDEEAGWPALRKTQ
jgi:hypothetical protein